MITWGMVGLGVIAHAFAKGLSSCNNARLLAVASADPAKAEAFAYQYQADHWYCSYEEVFAMQEVDVVYIANLNPQHADAVRLALMHNKHVLCEKPLTLDPQTSKELFELAEQKGLFLMEAYWTACLPTYRKAKEWIEKGMIGTVESIQVSFCFKADQNPASRLFNTALGGGALYDLGIYGISLALDFFNAYPVCVDAEIEYAQTGVDQYAHLLLDYGNSRRATLEFGFTEDKAHTTRIQGIKGSLLLPDFWHGTKIIRMCCDQILESQVFPHTVNGYEYEAQHVCDCITEGRSTSNLVPPHRTVETARLIKEVLSRANTVCDNRW